LLLLLLLFLLLLLLLLCGRPFLFLRSLSMVGGGIVE
jgi:hypothetical protein